MVDRLRRGRARVELRFDDPSQTPDVGLLLVAELADRLDLVGTLDRHIGPVKQRRRGVGGGALVMALAESMLVGGDFLCDLDTLRADTAGAALRTIACPPAPTTAAGLARRFGPAQLRGIETGLAKVTARAVGLLPAPRRQGLEAVRPTVDLDPTDVEVYGSHKQGVGWTYAGKRCGRPVLVCWAEAGVALAAELLAGNQDARPIAPGLVRRALAALPPGLGRPRVRADSGLFARQVAHAAVAADADFAIAAKRNPAVWRAIHAVPDDAWTPARGMPGAEVAGVAYAPAGWPEGTYAVVRRVRVGAADVSADPRAAGGAPSTLGSCAWPWAGSWTSCTPIRSSSPTSTTTRSAWKPGSVSAPRSRSASKTASWAWHCGTCPLARPRSTRCGCGQRCWR